MSDRYEFGIDGDARLVISLQSGDVEIYGTESGIEVSLTGKTGGVTVEQSGNTVSITSERKSSFFSAPSIRAAVGVPAGCDLEVSGASLDVVSRQRMGTVKVRTASGDIRLAEVSELDVKTASGEVRFEVVQGFCDITAASGDVVGDVVKGDLKANLASGDARIGRVDGDVVVKSASGDAHFDRIGGDEVSVRSMSGDIVLGLPSGIRLDFDLDALSGDVFLPPAAGSTPEGSDHEGADASGAPKRQVRVYARTVSGDIKIERAV